MNTTHSRRVLLSATLLLALGAQAAPPSTSPYATDTQNFYVQDATSDSIANLNMVLCVIAGLDASEMVNAGPYIALVDMNKCDSKRSGSGSNFATATVDVSRASNSVPMIGKVWMSFDSGDGSGTSSVYAYLNAQQSPSAANPYGVFRLDYVGKQGGVTGFNGYIDAQPTSIAQFETGGNSSNSAMQLTAGSTTSGSGTIASGGTTFDFAYDAAHFRRSDGTSDLCFDRSRTNAQVSVWQYGTYDASDGSRVDLAHPGFQVRATYNGNSYYGFASYWGINFQGLDLNALADAQPLAGVSVADQRNGNSTTYALSKVGGKLTKWTQQSATLGALDGIPFFAYTDMTARASGNPAVTGYASWQLVWSSVSQSFSVTGVQQCGGNGCTTTGLSPAAAVDAHAFDSQPLTGWAESYGGNLNIPQTGAPHQAADAIYYYLQSTVIPGSASLALYCLNQCPTGASLAAFAGGGNQGTPWGNGTGQQWFSAPAAGTVAYAFDGGGLEEASGGTPVPMVLSQSSQFPQGSQYAQNGITTGRLFDTPLAYADCPAGTPAGTVCEPANPSSYYTWQTGPQQWNQSLWLTTGGTIVAFDPPQNVPYQVPAGAAYGSYAGTSILLQYDGFGNLQGVPGYCVDPSSNATVDCSSAGARYVALFQVPDGTALTLPSPQRAILVKALNAEIRLANLGNSASTPCASMTLTPATPPTGGTHDPSNASDSEYLGTMPVVSGAPSVIDGVKQ